MAIQSRSGTDPDLLLARAGIYSPPHVNSKRKASRRAFNWRRSSHDQVKSRSQEMVLTKSFIADFLLRCTADEIRNNIASLMKIEYLSPKTTPWLIKWATEDPKGDLGVISLATLGFLAFPDQKIPGLRDSLFQTPGLIKNLLHVAVEQKLLLAKEITLDQLEFHETLGAGAGGYVYRAIYKHQQVAVKRFKLEDFWIGCEKEFYYEASIISLFGNFKHFIHCFGVNMKEGFIVMPIAQNKSLDKLISNGLAEHNWNDRIRIASQIAKAMATLHQYGIIHRDLKPANVLLDQQFNCYLCDFGVSSVKSVTQTRKRTMTMNIGTNVFMAPEVAEGNGYYFTAIDVYSFGVILWQMATEFATPYVDQGIPLHQVPQFIASGNRLEIPSTCPPNIANLISACWDGNPKRRPTFNQIHSMLSTM